MVRQLRGTFQIIVAGFSVALAIFHIYANVIGLSDLQWLPAIHFAGFALLCAIRYPLSPKLAHSPRVFVFDVCFGLLVMGATLYIIGSEDAIYAQGVKLSTDHWIATLITIFGAIELTRRTTGYIIPIIILISLAYATPLGAYVPGVLKFSGLSFETIAFRSIFADEGMFGIIGRISATFVFMFILFGAFLVRSGAGDFIIDLARVAAGRFVGGPGFVAIFASGLTGTISGSAVANTVSTGVITIPLMKKSGFNPRFAAGVEAASSTGGQVMPPIMGAGAFVMASNTQIPYLDIVAVSFLPAIVYFLSVAFFVRIEAKKHNITGGADSADTLMDVLRRGGPAFLIPIVTLIGLLIVGYTPVYAAGWAILSVVASSWLTPNKMGLRAIWDSLVMGTQNMIMTGVLLVAIGLMVNVIAMTGIGNTFSLMMAEWAGGNLLIAILLVALASLVLGMGLPVTAAYIVLATLSAPALQGLIQNGFLIDILVDGTLPETAKAPFMLINPEAFALLGAPMSLEAAQALIASAPPEILTLVYPSAIDPAMITAALLSAHMIIFWLSQDSNVTPPVCLTAFAAATIAGTPPMATGVTAWRLAKGLYIMPVLFAYTAFLYGSTTEILTIFVAATIAVYAFGAALEGHMEAPLNWALRAVVALAAGVLLWPGIPLWSGLALAIIIAVFVLNVRQDRKIRAVA
ncbi:MAG: C4-dicarboxylate ABC transporter permease [Hyphomicrobiales bacterium]|nr:MAG: C4-dicarboxylate ABC transporter permease [Hyphomicrobiales bacterium]